MKELLDKLTLALERAEGAPDRAVFAAVMLPATLRALMQAVEGIEGAPHDQGCMWIPPLWQTEMEIASDVCRCNCWKSRALLSISQTLEEKR